MLIQISFKVIYINFKFAQHSCTEQRKTLACTRRRKRAHKETGQLPEEMLSGTGQGQFAICNWKVRFFSTPLHFKRMCRDTVT